MSGTANQMSAAWGIGVRHAGDDGASAYRIPGLVTTNNGTLLGVYDIRYNSSVDLQEMVDIGVSRSTDKGQTWEPMRVAMTFGETGGLPHAQNGVGDPSILVDEKTNTIWIVAAWTHGMGNGRAWWNSMPGMSADSTAQLMLVKSEDDGKTWSQPINITPQVKDPSWYFLLQGPGRGITMKDGTLVFPIQFIDSTRIPNAGIMYSKDRGTTWHLHNLARTNTTEAQVAEIEPGVLMLNMRDNRGGSRAVATTRDLGKTWYEHPSSRSALQEPVCMASLIHVDAKDNITGKDLLIFSNPNTTKGRNHITIKVKYRRRHDLAAFQPSDTGRRRKLGLFLLVHDRQGDSRHLLRIERRPYDFSSCQTDRSGQVVLHETHTLHIDKFIYRDIGCLCCQYPSFASMAAESGMEREKVSI